MRIPYGYSRRSIARTLGLYKAGSQRALNVTALTRLRVRNASLSLLLAQKFLPIFRWAGSAQLPEHSRKVLLRFEAAGHDDI